MCLWRCLLSGLCQYLWMLGRKIYGLYKGTIGLWPLVVVPKLRFSIGPTRNPGDRSLPGTRTDLSVVGTMLQSSLSCAIAYASLISRSVAHPHTGPATPTSRHWCCVVRP